MTHRHKCVANNKIDIIDSKLREAVKKDHVQKNDWRILKLLIHGTENPIHMKQQEGPQQPQGDGPQLRRLTRECNARTVGTYLKTHHKGASIVKHTTGNTVTGALEAVDGLSSEAGPGCRTLRRDYDSLVFTLFDDRHSRRSSLGLGSIHVHLLLGALTGPLIAKLDLALPLCVEEAVPEDKEGLREVGLDAPALVMDIVVGSIV